MVLGRQAQLISISVLSLCGLLVILSNTQIKFMLDLSELGPVSLLHVGPLTAMMQARAALKYEDVEDEPGTYSHLPQPGDTVYNRVTKDGVGTQLFPLQKTSYAKMKSTHRHLPALGSKNDQHLMQEYEIANEKVSRLAARDAAKEQAANIGAGKVLKSYSSIVDSALSEYTSMSQAAEAELRGSLAAKKEKVLRTARRLRRLRKSAIEEVPDFVRKANAELMQAPYVRKRNPPASNIMQGIYSQGRRGVQAESSNWVGAAAPHSRPTEAYGNRHGSWPLAAPRRAASPSRANTARSIWQSIPPGADVQSLVESAVEKAMAQQAAQLAIAYHRPRGGPGPGRIQALSSTAGSPAGVGPGSQAEWANYLAQAHQDNNEVSSPPVSPARLPIPVATAYRVTFNSGSSVKPAAPMAEAAAPAQPAVTAYHGPAQRVSAAGAAPSKLSTAGPGIQLGRGGSGAREAAARLESLTTTVPVSTKATAPVPAFYSEEEAMERHLQEQINSIFGPDPVSESSALTSAGPSTVSATQPARDSVLQAAAKAGREGRQSKVQSAAAKKEAKEKAEEAKLQAVVHRLKEAERLQKLRRQVAFLRRERARIASLEGSVSVLRTQLVARERLEAEEARLARTAVMAARARLRTQALLGTERNETEAGEERRNETIEANATASKTLRVCDGFGCFYVPAPAPPPPPPPPLSPTEAAKQALNGDGDLWSLLIPWSGAWESEVGLDENGTIRAAHDDPQGRLMPHNSFQDEAKYPDGYHRSEPRAGISNFVAPHLFDDAIVPAQAGFNAGMGRHVRVQQASDWERNWCGEVGCDNGRPAAPPPPPTADSVETQANATAAGNSTEPAADSDEEEAEAEAEEPDEDTESAVRAT